MQKQTFIIIIFMATSKIVQSVHDLPQYRSNCVGFRDIYFFSGINCRNNDAMERHELLCLYIFLFSVSYLFRLLYSTTLHNIIVYFLVKIHCARKCKEQKRARKEGKKRKEKKSNKFFVLFFPFLMFIKISTLFLRLFPCNRSQFLRLQLSASFECSGRVQKKARRQTFPFLLLYFSLLFFVLLLKILSSRKSLLSSSLTLLLVQ